MISKYPKKTFVTSCPIYGLWCEWFIVRIHQRIGDKVHQDKVVTLDVVHRLVNELKSYYENSKVQEE